MREAVSNITPEQTRIHRLAGSRPIPLWLGPALLAGAAAVVAYFFSDPLGGPALAAALAGGALALVSFHVPIVPTLLLLLVAPFNYGVITGDASLKLSEGLAGVMLAVLLLRAAGGDPQLYQRVRRAGLPLAALALLGTLAILTAASQPNVFNVRYEIENYIACAYAIIFFRRAWWRPILWTVMAAILAESLAALALKFVYGLTGINFFNAGGVGRVQLSEEDLAGLAGGRFRLSGTMGHKNMLAAFYVLLLPLLGLEMLHKKRPLFLVVLLPALATLMLTDSMTGWGATLVITLLTLLYLRRFDYLALLVLVALPVGGVVLYKFGDSLFGRVQQLFGSYEGWGTVSSRVEIWNITKRLISENPWRGIGRNNFAFYGKTYYVHAHNLFAMKAIEMGVPAGVCFAGVILAMMARSWRAIARQAARLGAQQQYYRTLGLWLGCLGFIAMNLFDYNYSNFSLGVVFMMMLGILLAIAMDLEEAEG
jgi:O-antigen ligase